MVVLKQRNELFGMLEYEESRILGQLAYNTVFMPPQSKMPGVYSVHVVRMCVRYYVRT